MRGNGRMKHRGTPCASGKHFVRGMFSNQNRMGCFVVHRGERMRWSNVMPRGTGIGVEVDLGVVIIGTNESHISWKRAQFSSKVEHVVDELRFAKKSSTGVSVVSCCIE